MRRQGSQTDLHIFSLNGLSGIFCRSGPVLLLKKHQAVRRNDGAAVGSFYRNERSDVLPRWQIHPLRGYVRYKTHIYRVEAKQKYTYLLSRISL